MEAKKTLVAILVLCFVFSFPVVNSQEQPVGIAGYVKDAGGSPISGATVTVTNLNTGDNVSSTTNSYGLYTCVLYGENNDVIQAVATYGGITSTNSTTVDLSKLTTWLNISISSGISADFVWYPLVPKPKQKVTFQDRSTGNPDSWYWNFGDGTTGVGKNIEHTYEEGGRYSVTLEIRKGSAVSRRTKEITVSTEGDVPHIPPIQPPVYPQGYTMEQMCRLLRIDKLPQSHNKITVVVIDSGVTPRTYDNTDLTKVKMYHNPYYRSGIDEYGHGTFVNYEVAYILQRYAPNSIQYSFKTFGKYGQSTEDVFLQTLESVRKLHPDIVSISAGLLGNPNDAYSKEIEKMKDEGIIVVCAVGNFGPASSTILSPACSSSAIAVGASNPEKTIENVRDDTICIWSSRGPVRGIFEAKPDLVAPGESIRGAWKQGERIVSGTSMAAPLIAGGSAVILANEKGLADIVRILYFWNRGAVGDALESALEESCIKKGDANTWGAGIPNFEIAQGIFHWKLVGMIATLILVIIISIILLWIFLRHRDWLWDIKRRLDRKF